MFIEGCARWLHLEFISWVTGSLWMSTSEEVYPWTSFSFHCSSNNKGGLLVHFWLVFVMPHAKGHIFCEDCVAAILKDSIQTSIINRTSVGSLQGLAVDMDSVVLNGDYWVILLQALLPAVLLIRFIIINVVTKYSLPSVSTDSAFMDSTNHGFKIFRKKKIQKAPKSETWICCRPTNLKSILCWIS